MTRQEFLKLHEEAKRERGRRANRTLLWSGIILAVLIPTVYVLGKHVADHPEVLEVLRRFGMRGLLGTAGVGALICAFTVKPFHEHGVPCPHCHKSLYRGGVILGIISGNCCRCGEPLFEEEIAGIQRPG